MATQALDAKVLEILSATLGRDEKELTPETRLEDLGMDSLDRIDIAMAIEEMTSPIDDEEVEGWKKVADVLNATREAARR